jgi:hypothetical protein
MHRLLNLRAQRVSHALAAGADGCGEDTGLGLGVLLDLGDGVDETADETDTNGGDTRESDGGVEEDETGDGNGQLVQSTDHGIGGGGGGAHTPGGGVGDENGGCARENHGEEDAITVGLGEVAGQVGGRPVLDEKGQDDQDGDRQEVVVKHC